MSSSAQRMREILNATGAYHLDENSLIACETEACGIALDSLENEMNSVLSNLFAETADESGLNRLETLYSSQPSSAQLDDRRKAAKARLAMNPSHFTVKYLPDMLTAANILGEALEEDGKIRVLFGRAAGVSEQRAKADLAALLPAHIEIIWDETLNWATLAAFANSFSHVESLSLTWAQLDSLTREELENLTQEE